MCIGIKGVKCGGMMFGGRVRVLVCIDAVLGGWSEG